MKKILIITNRISLSGSTIHVLELVKHITPFYKVKLIAGTLEPEEESALHLFEEAGISPLIIKEMVRSVSISKDRVAYSKLKKEIEGFRPDIVHTHTSKAGALGRMAADACNVSNIIHTFHGTIFEGHFSKLKSYGYLLAERYLAKKTDKIIALSQSQNEDLVQKYRIASTDKIITIPLGLSLQQYQENRAPKRQKFRNEFGVFDDVVLIGIVGRLVRIKDHKLFVDALKIIKKTSKKEVKGVIVGDGEERRAISQYILDQEMTFSTSGTGDFIFTSWRLDMDTVFAGLDLMLVTSINEGTPVCIMESQAAGVPIVTVDVGGIKDIVSPQSALLIEDRTPKKIGQKVLDVINNKELSQAMSKAGLIQSQSFSIDVMIKKMKQIYNEPFFN